MSTSNGIEHGELQYIIAILNLSKKKKEELANESSSESRLPTVEKSEHESDINRLDEDGGSKTTGS